MKRPVGVTVVAVSAIVVGIYSFVGRLWTIRDFLPMQRFVFTQPKTWVGVLWVGLPFLGGLIYTVVGIGLWRLRKWARRLAIFLCLLVMVDVAVIFILGHFNRNFFNVDLWLQDPWPLLLPVALYGLCLGYMFTDEVKQAFSA